MIRKIPFLLAILGMAGGVLIAIFFATNEDGFQTKIRAGLEKNAKIMEIADPAKREEKISKDSGRFWKYYQRFHFHATGIGAMMMGLLLFLTRLNAPVKFVTLSSYMVSLGGFLYPFVWLFAGIYGPEMGAEEAKEAFAIFGYMGGIFLVGTILTFILALRFDLKD